jgi:hypothetical protein
MKEASKKHTNVVQLFPKVDTQRPPGPKSRQHESPAKTGGHPKYNLDRMFMVAKKMPGSIMPVLIRHLEASMKVDDYPEDILVRIIKFLDDQGAAAKGALPLLNRMLKERRYSDKFKVSIARAISDIKQIA